MECWNSGVSSPAARQRPIGFVLHDCPPGNADLPIGIVTGIGFVSRNAVSRQDAKSAKVRAGLRFGLLCGLCVPSASLRAGFGERMDLVAARRRAASPRAIISHSGPRPSSVIRPRFFASRRKEPSKATVNRSSPNAGSTEGMVQTPSVDVNRKPEQNVYVAYFINRCLAGTNERPPEM